MKTESELAFEDYFTAQGIKVAKIAEGKEKTPDYRIFLNSIEIIVEVKQFDASAQERQRLNNLKEGELLILDAKPGKGVRKKITDGSEQLRKLAKDRCAAVLLLYNNRPFMLGNPASAYDVRVGMYGFESIVLVRGRTGQPPQVKDRKFGGSRKLTKVHNTTISAIAMMERRGEETVFRLYHNEYAAFPLPHCLFAQYGVSEFALSKRRIRQFQDWEAVNCS